MYRRTQRNGMNSLMAKRSQVKRIVAKALRRIGLGGFEWKSSGERAARGGSPNPYPTLANVAYGTHPRQVLDFWRANSSEASPLIFFIHGGSWRGGSKSHVSHVAEYLAAGISVVSIEYRFIAAAVREGIMPPVKGPMDDAARALQFVRSKAAEWNIDKIRIAASGGSAGACSALWLGFHSDLSHPMSTDPIARESTRLWCIAGIGAQTSLDPMQMKEWIPNSRYGGHAFGFRDNVNGARSGFEQFLESREAILHWIIEYSPYAHLSASAPPVYLAYKAPPALGQEQDDPTHSANFGVKLQEKCKRLGVSCELVYPGAPDVKHASVRDYLIAMLNT
jgi:acetyl esterase/lipase